MLKDIRFPSINHPVYQSTQTSDTAAWQELTLASDPDLFRREQNAQRQAKQRQEQQIKEAERLAEVRSAQGSFHPTGKSSSTASANGSENEKKGSNV
jgi:hypothetical protein